jgi:hypothetical protein
MQMPPAITNVAVNDKFLRQFGHGNGDYTRDRKKLLGNQSVQAITRRIRSRKKI